MKTKIILGYLFLLSLSCVAQEPQNAPRAAVYQEAENFRTQTSDEVRKWVVIDKNSTEKATQQAGGNAYVQCLPDTRVTHDDKLIKGTNFSDKAGQMAVLTYPVKFKKPGATTCGSKPTPRARKITESTSD